MKFSQPSQKATPKCRSYHGTEIKNTFFSIPLKCIFFQKRPFLKGWAPLDGRSLKSYDDQTITGRTKNKGNVSSTDLTEFRCVSKYLPIYGKSCFHLVFHLKALVLPMCNFLQKINHFSNVSYLDKHVIFLFYAVILTLIYCYAHSFPSLLQKNFDFRMFLTSKY